jgi:hypothetical protein
VGHKHSGHSNVRLPTWLLFTFLIVAAFAPAAGRWRGWWFIYYGALFACWVWMSVVAARRAAREDRKRQRKIARLLRQHRNAQKIALDQANARGVPRALPLVRRFIAAADRSDAYDEIRKLTGGGDDVVVITDRREEDRRHRVDGYVVERRHTERRRQDIRSFLLTRGWAEVKPVITKKDEEATF